MEVLPQRSSGVLLAPFRDGALAYDQVTETRHRLNATAGTLLSRCDGETAVAEIVDSWATATGASASEVTAGVRQAVDEFARLGLVGRHEPWEVPSRLPGSTTPALDGATTGRVHPALDRTVVFRSTDRDLIAAIDDYLGAGELEIHGPTSEPLVIDVEYRPDGQIRARFGDEFVFSRLETCLLQITTAVDRLTDAPTDFPVLHAGAVRAPTGEIVLVTAESGGGKRRWSRRSWPRVGATWGTRPSGFARTERRWGIRSESA